jgi:hypothetical protein
MDAQPYQRHDAQLAATLRLLMAHKRRRVRHLTATLHAGTLSPMAVRDVGDDGEPRGPGPGPDDEVVAARALAELQLRFLAEYEAALQGALAGLAAAVDEGDDAGMTAATWPALVTALQHHAHDAHVAALQADRLYSDAVEHSGLGVGVGGGNSTIDEVALAAAAARRRRGGELLEEVKAAADRLEQGLSGNGV